MQPKIATRAALQAVQESPEVLFIADATSVGGLYVRRLTTAELNAARDAAKRTNDDGSLDVDFNAAQQNILAAALLNSADPSDRMFGLGEGEAVRATFLPGEFDRLALIESALLGYNTSETARLGFYRSGQSSPSGASTGSDGTPPSSASTPAACSTPGGTTVD